MRAVLIDRQGGVDEFVLRDVPDPVPGASEVLVRVRAVSLNHLDVFARSGRNGVRLPLPQHVLGSDIAGDVVALGADVRGVELGDRVVVNPIVSCDQCEACQRGRENLCTSSGMLGISRPGGYAELAAVPARNVFRISEDVDYDEASCLPTASLTAWRCLVHRARIEPGETVLVHAAGSGVGSAAIQIARLYGCRVIATVGSHWKAERAFVLGADFVVNYTTTPEFSEEVLRLTDGVGVDVLLDHIGEAIWDQNFRSLARGGRLVNCGVTAGHRVPLHLGQVFTRNLSILGSSRRTRAEMSEMLRVVESGELRGVVFARYPLEAIAEAHEKLESRSIFGKIVVNP